MGVMLRRFMRPRQSAPSGAAWRGRALGINGCSWLLTTQSRRANDAAMAAPRTVSAAGTQSDPAGLPRSAEQGGAQGGPLALTVQRWPKKTVKSLKPTTLPLIHAATNSA